MESIAEFYQKYHIILNAAFIIRLAIILSRVSQVLINRYLQDESKKTTIDITRYRFFRYLLVTIIWFVAIAAIIWMQPKLRALATSLFAGAGLIVVFIGLAAQQAFANLIGGIFIVIFKPFRVGDMIKVGNLEFGIVVDITLRHTVIRNFENNHIMIPNANINSDVVVNNSITDERVVRHLAIGISYDSDIDRAIRIIQEEGEKHPNSMDVRTPQDLENGAPYVRVRVVNYGQSSIDLKAYVWVDSWDNGWATHCDILESVKKRFDREGIEIPFPYRTLVYKNDLMAQKEEK
jgi:small conductance mechanosensitive channel